MHSKVINIPNRIEYYSLWLFANYVTEQIVVYLFIQWGNILNTMNMMNNNCYGSASWNEKTYFQNL